MLRDSASMLRAPGLLPEALGHASGPWWGFEVEGDAGTEAKTQLLAITAAVDTS